MITAGKRMLGIGSPVPKDIQEEIDILAAEFENLKSTETDRLARYETYREELYSARLAGLDVNRSRRDYGRKLLVPAAMGKHNIKLPLGQALTVKHTYRVAGRPPDCIVDRRNETALEKYRSETMERIWWAIYHGSQGDQQVATGAWEGSQLGSSLFDLYWHEGSQMPRFRALDPAGFLVVPGVEDPHEFQRIYRFWAVPVKAAKAEYGDHDFRGDWNFVDRISKTHTYGTSEMVTLVEVSDKGRLIRFALGGHVPLWENVHSLGFCPGVVIPNIGPERAIWGWSDYEFVRDLLNYVPQLISRQADIIRQAAGGGYTAEATGQTPQEISKILKEGGVLPIREKGSIKPIPGPEEPKFLPDHVSYVMELFRSLGFAPSAAWGDAASTSGSDRGLQLMPMIELTAMKQMNWAAGLGRLASMSYRMIEQKLNGPVTYRGSVPSNNSRKMTRFSMLLEPGKFEQVPNTDETGLDPFVDLPQGPVELFDGDYSARFVWQNRIDPDDPAFVMSEINKFVQSVQSLETTLERLGFQVPQDEINRIKRESNEMPWLNDGRIKYTQMLLKQQEQQLGEEGAPPDVAGGVLSALQGMTGGEQGVANDADFGSSALPGESGVGIPYGGA